MNSKVNTNVLVTGGSGFLGSHLIDELLSSGSRVYALEHRKPIISRGKVNLIKGGIKVIDRSLLDDINPNVIYHCARPSFPALRRTGRHIAGRLAAKLNRKLIEEALLAKKQPTIVFASGSLMYGNSERAHDESAPLDPISYAKQYYRGEIPLVEAAKKGKLPLIILRLPWLLGNGSWFRWFYLEHIKRKGVLPVFGDAGNMMEVLDVIDAAKLMIDYSRTYRSGIFNIPSRMPISQQAFLEEIISIFDAKIMDYREIIGKAMENEALEAFTSNILLKTKFPDVVEKFEYTSLKTSLERVRKEDN